MTSALEVGDRGEGSNDSTPARHVLFFFGCYPCFFLGGRGGAERGTPKSMVQAPEQQQKYSGLQATIKGCTSRPPNIPLQG